MLLGRFPSTLLASPSEMPNLNVQDIRNQSNETVDAAKAEVATVHKILDVQAPPMTNIVESDKADYGHTGPLDCHYFHPDHLGSSSYITNLDCVVSQHMEYLPFGETMVDEHLNSRNSPFKYNGKEFDEETGNYYYGARYYDPKWSIWVSVDPLAEQTMDAYGYYYNNPIKFTDPDGRSPLDIIINLFDMSSGKYMEYARIKSETYKFSVNVSLPYPFYGISLAPDTSQKKTYGDYRGISGKYKFDEVAASHGNPDAVLFELGANISLGFGAGVSASVALMLKGKDEGKAGLYSTINQVTGFEASVGLQASFMFSDIPLSEFRLNTLEGYSEGYQGGYGLGGGSSFKSYDGEYKGNWLTGKTFQKKSQLYHI